MRPINLIANSVWIFPLCLHYAIICDISKIPSVNRSNLFLHNDLESRVIFTNNSAQLEPIAINLHTYHSFICDSEFFIDNSRLIQYIESLGSLAILLPRRFGKSLNLLLLKCFYEIPVVCVDKVCKPVPKEETEAYQIFQNGLLTTCRDKIVKLHPNLQIKSLEIIKRMNKVPVLHLTFQRMAGGDMTSLNVIYGYIITQICRVYIAHYYLKYDYPAYNKYYAKLIDPPKDDNSRRELINNAIKHLIWMMHMFFNKPVMLLMDEYDSLLNTAFLSENPLPEDEKKKLLAFFGTFFNGLLKDNDSISKSVLTGIISWKNTDILSALLHVTTVTAVHDFPINCYGFSETDLHTMYEHFTSKCQKVPDPENKLQEYYDGYLFGGNNMKRYNPISIAKYFTTPFSHTEKRLRPYWAETGDAAGLLHQFIKYSNFANDFLALLLSKGFYTMPTSHTSVLSLEAIQSITKSSVIARNLPPNEWYVTTNKDNSNVFLYLFATGYLTKSKESNDSVLMLQIPNKEVRDVLWKNYYEILTGNKDTQKENNDRFQNALDTFAPFLGNILKTDETNCSNLAEYFNKVLLELPEFTKTKYGREEPYYYASEALVESTLSGVLNWFFNQLSREQQHDFKKSKKLSDRKHIGRPDIAVIYKHSITIFEFKFDTDFDHAYIQAMKYFHLYFPQKEYDEINQIKVIPFVVKMDKSVITNATICTREAFKKVEAINPTIRDELTSILENPDTISSACNATCIGMRDWTHWNCGAEKEVFDSWHDMVLKNCQEWLTEEMKYFKPRPQ